MPRNSAHGWLVSVTKGKPLSLGVNYHSYSYSFDEGTDVGGKLRNRENNDSKLNYSVGIADINKSKENTEYHINYCGQSKDTVTITLP